MLDTPPSFTFGPDPGRGVVRLDFACHRAS